MSEIIIETIKDLFENYQKLISSRYVGDFEFKEFKSFLTWKRSFGFVVNILLIILSVSLIFKTLIFISSDYVNLFILILSISMNLIISYGLIIFSLVNIFELWKTKKYLVKKDFKKIKSFKWSEWQFIDIIFSNPHKLEKEKEIEIKIDKSPDYSLNFLCQYPTGNFAWFGIGKSHNEKHKINNKTFGDKSFEDKKFRNKEVLKIQEKFIIDNMKMDLYEEIFDGKKIILKLTSKNILPATIVGIRIRANVKNYPIVIKNLKMPQ